MNPWGVVKSLLGVPSEQERLYAKPERLADVMALIQVLALDEDTHRSEEGLRKELQKPKPTSTDSWTEVANQHPEFFRVNVDSGYGVSLVGRHVLRKADNGRRPQLSAEHVASLLQAAVDLHDRQVRRSERWTYLVPIWVALIGLLAAWFLGTPSESG